jgi:glutamate-1-semialdehyde 2,1-aminomutase
VTVPGARTQALEAWARERVPGATSSPARDALAMGVVASPIGCHGRGPYLTDVEGRTYVDYLQAFGPGILGHGHPAVVAAVAAAAADGPLWGLASRAEARLADRLIGALAGVERVRFTASGTEAVMAAIRLARAATARDRLVKFDAGYHGHADVVLGDTGSAAAHAAGAAGQAPAGVPAGVLGDTVTLPWNDAAALDRYLAAEGRAVAAVLVEPVAGNIGIVAPDPGFVAAVNRARGHGALVIADEVVSAFRFRYGDAATLVGLEGDLTCVGKIIGGGLPIGAYGGGRALMARVAPEGDVFQAGTYAGHPLSCAAGQAVLGVLAQAGAYEHLAALGERLERGLRGAAAAAAVPLSLNRVGGALTAWPGRDEARLGPVRTRADVEASPEAPFAALYRGLLERGVLLPPSRFEAWLTTLAHDNAAVERTLGAASAAFAAMARP